MKYPVYERYKDSGVEWLVEVPENWSVERLFDIALINTSNVDKKVVEGQSPIKLCNYTDVYYNAKIHSGLEFMRSSASKIEIDKYRLFKNDVVITKDSESPFDIGVASFVCEDIDDLVCGYHLSIIKPMNKNLNGLFLYYALSCDLSAYQFCIAANGVTRFGLSYNALKNIKIPVPSVCEQKIIADFLCHKTAQIDRLIEKKQALIETLNEKRTALITRAVTKGLDESVLMKDSGVEWLGAVPAHWDVLRLRFVIQNIEQGWSPQCHNYPADDEQWGVMKVGCVNGNSFDASDNKALPENIDPKKNTNFFPVTF
jgi:type I restriction enzyme S subunit